MSRILIIDDEKNIRKSLREILEFEKHTVDEAIDGAEGFEMATKNNFDLIFLACKIKPIKSFFALIQTITIINTRESAGAST